jgi:hypothetical protein
MYCAFSTSDNSAATVRPSGLTVSARAHVAVGQRGVDGRVLEAGVGRVGEPRLQLFDLGGDARQHRVDRGAAVPRGHEELEGAADAHELVGEGAVALARQPHFGGADRAAVVDVQQRPRGEVVAGRLDLHREAGAARHDGLALRGEHHAQVSALRPAHVGAVGALQPDAGEGGVEAAEHGQQRHGAHARRGVAHGPAAGRGAPRVHAGEGGPGVGDGLGDQRARLARIDAAAGGEGDRRQQLVAQLRMARLDPVGQLDVGQGAAHRPEQPAPRRGAERGQRGEEQQHPDRRRQHQHVVEAEQREHAAGQQDEQPAGAVEHEQPPEGGAQPVEDRPDFLRAVRSGHVGHLRCSLAGWPGRAPDAASTSSGALSAVPTNVPAGTVPATA